MISDPCLLQYCALLLSRTKFRAAKGPEGKVSYSYSVTSNKPCPEGNQSLRLRPHLTKICLYSKAGHFSITVYGCHVSNMSSLHYVTDHQLVPQYTTSVTLLGATRLHMPSLQTAATAAQHGQEGLLSGLRSLAQPHVSHTVSSIHAFLPLPQPAALGAVQPPPK